MKKKWLIPVLAALAAASLTLALTACSDGGAQYSGVREEFTGSMYADTVPSWREQALVDGGYTFTGEGVTLDGKLDEAAWQQVYPLTYTSVGVTVSVYVVFGEDGFYVGYDVEDNEAYFHENRASENNSSIEIYFSPVGTTALDETVLQVRMEPNNDFTCYRAISTAGAQLTFPWSAEYLPVYGLSQAETEWVADESTGGMVTHGGLQFEMFVGWDTLSLTEQPESIKLYPCYNYINNSRSDSRRTSQVWPQGRYNEPMDYYTFDASGYVGNDERLTQVYGEDLLFGDAANGLSKSSGWDISDLLESNTVRSTQYARGSHYLYIKGSDTADYLFSVKAQFITDVNNAGARMGILLGRQNSNKTNINMYTETFAVAVQGDNIGKYQLTHKVGDDEGGKFVSWESTALTPYSGANGTSGSDPVELTVVKQGSLFFYFANGAYLGSVSYPRFAEGGAVGLYSLGAQATFTDIRYETDADAIAQYLDEANVRLVTVETNVGGTFSGTVGGAAFDASQTMTAFVGTADIDLTIRPTIDAARTYIIESVTVGGEPAELSEGGRLSIAGCTTDVEIAITFAPVTSGAQIAFTGGSAQVTIVQSGGVNSYTLEVAQGLTVRLADGTWQITPQGGEAVTIVVENGAIVDGDGQISVPAQ